MQDAWPESSSENAINLAKKVATNPEISIFSRGLLFWRALYRLRIAIRSVIGLMVILIILIIIIIILKF